MPQLRLCDKTSDKVRSTRSKLLGQTTSKRALTKDRRTLLTYTMNSLPRIPSRALQSNLSSWACASCRRELARARQLPARTTRKPISNTTKAQQDRVHQGRASPPPMAQLREYYKQKNRTTMYARCHPRDQTRPDEMGASKRPV